MLEVTLKYQITCPDNAHAQGGVFQKLSNKIAGAFEACTDADGNLKYLPDEGYFSIDEGGVVLTIKTHKESQDA